MLDLTLALAVAVVAQVSGPLSHIPPKMLAPKPDAARVVATVNGRQVTVGDVDGLLWDWRSEEVVTDAVNYLIVKTEADRQSVKVDPLEVEKEMDKQLAAYAKQLPPGSDLDAELRKQGFAKSRIYLGVETQLLANKLMMRQFDPSEFIKVSTIVVKPKSDQATDVGAAIKVAEQAYQKLVKGTAWDQVLKSCTTNPAALKENGLLGWRLMNAFPPSAQDEMKKLKAGGLTKPVQTVNGIQIFRVDMQGRDAKGPELETLKAQYVMGNQKAFMENLKASAKIERPK